LNYKTKWQHELAGAVTSVEELADLGYVKKEKVEKLSKIAERYPIAIPRYYLNLIKEKDYGDPIYKMCVVSEAEGGGGGASDTSGEFDNTVSEGIQHKYRNTVLLLSTNVCAMYCRHCFRKRLVGQSEEEVLKFTDKAIDYIKRHPEVDNVLISGGDALLNTNRVIERYLSGLSQIAHLKFIRFGSRAPVVFPQRINEDKELVELFGKYGKLKTIYLVTQFNHPRELTGEAISSTDLMRHAGVPVLNQTVLLKGVNDDAETLVKLFNGLARAGISPYYLFQCRPVKGVKNLFAVPLKRACEIVDATKANLSGVAKRFKFAMSHVKGKIEILGNAGGGKLLFKQHQAKRAADINNFFMLKVGGGEAWLSDDLTKAI
jgi:lysine 2,3-aminomutase